MKIQVRDSQFSDSDRAVEKVEISPSEDRVREQLLLVDDSELFRERLARAFRDRDFEVRTAADYDEAMRLARKAAPDLAVVDLRMPGRSGLELVRDLLDVLGGWSH